MSLEAPETRLVRAEDIRAGHAIVFDGLGAFLVREIVPGGPTGRLAVLAWDDLAVALRPGTCRRCRLPIPERRTTRPLHPPGRTGQPIQGGDDELADLLPVEEDGWT